MAFPNNSQFGYYVLVLGTFLAISHAQFPANVWTNNLHARDAFQQTPFPTAGRESVAAFSSNLQKNVGNPLGLSNNGVSGRSQSRGTSYRKSYGSRIRRAIDRSHMFEMQFSPLTDYGHLQNGHRSKRVRRQAPPQFQTWDFHPSSMMRRRLAQALSEKSKAFTVQNKMRKTSTEISDKQNNITNDIAPSPVVRGNALLSPTQTERIVNNLQPADVNVHLPTAHFNALLQQNKLSLEPQKVRFAPNVALNTAQPGTKAPKISTTRQNNSGLRKPPAVLPNTSTRTKHMGNPRRPIQQQSGPKYVNSGPQIRANQQLKLDFTAAALIGTVGRDAKSNPQPNSNVSKPQPSSVTRTPVRKIPADPATNLVSGNNMVLDIKALNDIIDRTTTLLLKYEGHVNKNSKGKDSNSKQTGQPLPQNQKMELLNARTSVPQLPTTRQQSKQVTQEVLNVNDRPMQLRHRSTEPHISNTKWRSRSQPRPTRNNFMLRNQEQPSQATSGQKITPTTVPFQQHQPRQSRQQTRQQLQQQQQLHQQQQQLPHQQQQQQQQLPHQQQQQQLPHQQQQQQQQLPHQQQQQQLPHQQQQQHPHQQQQQQLPHQQQQQQQQLPHQQQQQLPHRQQQQQQQLPQQQQQQQQRPQPLRSQRQQMVTQQYSSALMMQNQIQQQYPNEQAHVLPEQPPGQQAGQQLTGQMVNAATHLGLKQMSLQELQQQFLKQIANAQENVKSQTNDKSQRQLERRLIGPQTSSRRNSMPLPHNQQQTAQENSQSLQNGALAQQQSQNSPNSTPVAFKNQPQIPESWQYNSQLDQQKILNPYPYVQQGALTEVPFQTQSQISNPPFQNIQDTSLHNNQQVSEQIMFGAQAPPGQAHLSDPNILSTPLSSQQNQQQMLPTQNDRNSASLSLHQNSQLFDSMFATAGKKQPNDSRQMSDLHFGPEQAAISSQHNQQNKPLVSGLGPQTFQGSVSSRRAIKPQNLNSQSKIEQAPIFAKQNQQITKQPVAIATDVPSYLEGRPSQANAGQKLYPAKDQHGNQAYTETPIPGKNVQNRLQPVLPTVKFQRRLDVLPQQPEMNSPILNTKPDRARVRDNTRQRGSPIVSTSKRNSLLEMQQNNPARMVPPNKQQGLQPELIHNNPIHAIPPNRPRGTRPGFIQNNPPNSAQQNGQKDMHGTSIPDNSPSAVPTNRLQGMHPGFIRNNPPAAVPSRLQQGVHPEVIPSNPARTDLPNNPPIPYPEPKGIPLPIDQYMSHHVHQSPFQNQTRQEKTVQMKQVTKRPAKRRSDRQNRNRNRKKTKSTNAFRQTTVHPDIVQSTKSNFIQYDVNAPANTALENPLKAVSLWNPAPDVPAGHPIVNTWRNPKPKIQRKTNVSEKISSGRRNGGRQTDKRGSVKGGQYVKNWFNPRQFNTPQNAVHSSQHSQITNGQSQGRNTNTQPRKLTGGGLERNAVHTVTEATKRKKKTAQKFSSVNKTGRKMINKSRRKMVQNKARTRETSGRISRKLARPRGRSGRRPGNVDRSVDLARVSEKGIISARNPSRPEVRSKGHGRRRNRPVQKRRYKSNLKSGRTTVRIDSTTNMYSTTPLQFNQHANLRADTSGEMLPGTGIYTTDYPPAVRSTDAAVKAKTGRWDLWNQPKSNSSALSDISFVPQTANISLTRQSQDIKQMNQSTGSDIKRNKTISITQKITKSQNATNSEKGHPPINFNVFLGVPKPTYRPQTMSSNKADVLRLLTALSMIRDNLRPPTTLLPPVKIVLQVEHDPQPSKVKCRCFPKSDGCPSELKEEPLMDMCDVQESVPCCEDG